MARVHFRQRRSDQLVDQVIGLHAEALAPGDFNVGAALILFGKHVAKIHGAARSQSHHFIREVMIVVGLFGETHAAQCLDHVVLRIGLARVDDVIDGIRVSEMRQSGCRLVVVLGGDPAAIAVGIDMEQVIAEVEAKLVELPQVIRDVFADVADGAIGAHNHLGFFIGIFAVRTCGSCATHHPAAGILAFCLLVEDAFFFHQPECGIPKMQMEDLTFARQKLVFNAKPHHGFKMASQDRGGH